MAKEKNNKSVKQDRVKRTLLLAFVFASVLMIGAIWIEGIVEPEPETPGYYRGDIFVVDESIYLTVTADALKYNPVDGTPEADEHHQGSGSGQGSGSNQGSESGNSDGGSDH